MSPLIMQNVGQPSASAAIESLAVEAERSGRGDEAALHWQRLVEVDPKHGRALAALGQRAFRRGEFTVARAFFQRSSEAGPSTPQLWIQLALCCRNLDDSPAEAAAIREALTRDPMDLLALVLRADLLEREGKAHEAAGVYIAITSVAPPLERLHPDLRPAVTQAHARIEQYNRQRAAFIDERLEGSFREFAGEDLRRFRDSVDIMLGHKRRYDSLPTHYFFPGLPPIGFFDRAHFPWYGALEAATDAIRDEFLAVLAADEGFTPYLSYADDLPLNQFAELNNSPRWSAFHLYKMGERVAANAALCPRTMAALAATPQPEQPGRTPAAMFSLLKPKTRIPPHTGVSNVRLVTHLPLIVPEGCEFRVGSETRSWIPGQAWTFDDTIEHEAWNGSDKLRVVLLFDVWNPFLTPPERAMVTALSSVLNAFTAGAPPGLDPM